MPQRPPIPDDNEDADVAFREAEARIAEWRTGQRLDLSIPGLASLPASIGALLGLQHLSCSWTSIDDLAPLAGLQNLQHLDCGNTQVHDLAPLAGLRTLQHLNCSGTKIDDLAPLAELQNLQGLVCVKTQIDSLAPLAGLHNLQHLHCSHTEINDLAPLAGLHNLQHLHCSHTEINDLAPLAGLRTLQHLDCNGTQVHDLAPLAGLRTLQHLDCGNTQVHDLAPLAELQNLQHLNCSWTKISDLAPLAGLQNLQHLECSGTQVRDLAPLAGLQNLHYLFCAHAQVHDLTPLTGLQNLQHLDCFGTQISDLRPLYGLKPMAHLLTPPHIPGLPEEVLSQSLGDNCAKRFYAHVADLGEAPQRLKQAKIMILGNGRVGKTKIRRRLMGDAEWCDQERSTHGIHIALLPPNPTLRLEGGQLSCWDFGGQDIYHGTHALFLQSRSIFLVCWTQALEAPGLSEPDEFDHVSRNYPLSYWLDYVYKVAGPQAALVVVHTQCDQTDSLSVPPDAERALQQFDHSHVLCYSAKTDRNRGMLHDAISQAYGRLNLPYVGPGRLAVKADIDGQAQSQRQLRNTDRHKPLISRQDFGATCQGVRAQGLLISDEAMLLRFLHDAGSLFQLQGLPDTAPSLVLDQQWILDVLYAVLERGTMAQRIRARRGRFQRHELDWDQTYSQEQQKQFLDMMLACDAAFIEHEDEQGDHRYVVPALLPDAPRLDWCWQDAAEACLSCEQAYDFLSPQVIRSIIAHIGRLAGERATYGQHCVEILDDATHARGLIRQELDSGAWQGKIIIQTHSHTPDGALQLLAQLHSEVRKALRGSGYDFQAVLPETAPQRADTQALRPKAPREAYVSYAWANEEHPDIEREVDRLEQEAKSCGLALIRDKREMKTGDSIRAFMDKLGRAERVYVVLSARYLRSEACIYELARMWEASGGDMPDLAQRLRVIVLPCAEIYGDDAVLKHITYWNQRAQEREANLQAAGTAATPDFLERGRLLKLFALHLAEILDFYQDRMRPSFDDLIAELHNTKPE